MTLDRAYGTFESHSQRGAQLSGELASAKPHQLARSRFAAKSAPQHRDFAAVKVGTAK